VHSTSETLPSRRAPRNRLINRIRIAGWTALSALLLGVIVFLVWTQLVLPADRDAVQAVFDDTAVSVTDTESSIVIAPSGLPSGLGLVFIPGAKVDPYAYLATLAGTVEQTGLTVVITKPTLNLAFFDQRPLDTFTEAAPGVTGWFVGGHSLGGVRACMFAQDPANAVAGLVLFGSYCASLIDGDLPVLSLSGSEDGLSTPAKIQDSAALLPPNTHFEQIEGASHASFGAYGSQPGDGVPTLSEAEAQEAITTALSSFVIQAFIVVD
jgi:hypothetical protein